MDKQVFDLEVSHMSNIRKKLKSEINLMHSESSRLKEAVILQNREMRETLGSAPSQGDFDAYVGFAQALSIEKQLLEQRGHHEVRLLKYLKMLKKLYFARLDYAEENAAVVENIYIGYGNFMDDRTMEIHIYDWRSPIAGIYYDYSVGPVRYTAPDGTISGEVFLKRQFEVEKGRLVSYFDTKISIVDERLIQTLASREAGKMGEIVETIGAEQNRIVREVNASAVFVEGIAGSGKTVVALHRIAYLMYHGLVRNLEAHQVLILSPNALFSNYIEGVLPDLGESKVMTLTLSELIEKAMAKFIGHETLFSQIERELLGRQSHSERIGLRVKNDLRVLNCVKDALSLYLERKVVIRDFYYGETLIVPAGEMRQIISDADFNRPVLKRLGRFAERVRNKGEEARKRLFKERVAIYAKQPQNAYEAKSLARLDCIAASRQLKRELDELVGIDAMGIYRILLKAPEIWQLHFEEVRMNDIQAMCADTLKRLDNRWLSQLDLVLVCHIHLLMSGDHGVKGIKHVVVDESQDYSLLSFALLKALFPDAHFTVLGDNHQTVLSERLVGLHERVASVLGFRDAVHMELTIGYRNQQAISAFCLSFFKEESGYSMVPRDGEKPRCFTGTGSLLRAIDHLVSLQCGTIAVITKTNKQAREVYQRLSSNLSVHLIDASHSELPKGILIIPVYFAKGLEFDGVVVYECSAENYKNDQDLRLAYVASSRALHALCIQSEAPLAKLFEERKKWINW